jgi:hypothetical protein
LKTNHKRLLLGLVTAAVLLPGAASAAPLNAVLAPRDPAVEPVSLDETALAAGSRPAGEKPARARKEHRHQQETLEKKNNRIKPVPRGPKLPGAAAGEIPGTR